MGVPVTHADERAHRRLLAGNINQLQEYQPILYPVQDATGLSAVEFTDIPNWVQRITITFDGAINSNGNNYRVQVAENGVWSLAAANYISASARITNSTAFTGSTEGIVVFNNANDQINYGPVTITKISDTSWATSHSMVRNNPTAIITGGGMVTVNGEVTGVRVTMNAGTFTAGEFGCRVER